MVFRAVVWLMMHRVCFRRFGLVTENRHQDEELADSTGFSVLCKHLNQRILSLKMVFSNEYEMSATNSVLNVQNEARSLLEYFGSAIIIVVS